MIISTVFLKMSNKFVIMSLKKRQKKVVGNKRRKIKWRWTIIWKEVWKFKWFLPTVIAITRKMSLKNWFKTSSLLLKRRQAKNPWGNQMKKFKKTTNQNLLLGKITGIQGKNKLKNQRKKDWKSIKVKMIKMKSSKNNRF